MESEVFGSPEGIEKLIQNQQTNIHKNYYGESNLLERSAEHSEHPLVAEVCPEHFASCSHGGQPTHERRASGKSSEGKVSSFLSLQHVQYDHDLNDLKFLNCEQKREFIVYIFRTWVKCRKLFETVLYNHWHYHYISTHFPTAYTIRS